MTKLDKALLLHDIGWTPILDSESTIKPYTRESIFNDFPNEEGHIGVVLGRFSQNLYVLMCNNSKLIDNFKNDKQIYMLLTLDDKVIFFFSVVTMCTTEKEDYILYGESSIIMLNDVVYPLLEKYREQLNNHTY